MCAVYYNICHEWLTIVHDCAKQEYHYGDVINGVKASQITCEGVSNHQPHDCLLKRLFRRRSKETSKLCGTGLCVGNSPVTGEFPAQRASNAEDISIWWRHHVFDEHICNNLIPWSLALPGSLLRSIFLIFEMWLGHGWLITSNLLWRNYPFMS